MSEQAQAAEASWWGDCTKTLGEEIKQLLYARYMGLNFFEDTRSPFNIDLGGRSVLDIGGGPVSLLLKCVNSGRSAVVDPLPIPDWVRARYIKSEIEYYQIPAEQLFNEFTPAAKFDEVWIYNVLQHVDDPVKVIENARAISNKKIRVFEWLNTDINEMHPNSFTKAQLDTLFNKSGYEDFLTGNNTCWGPCYFGVFDYE
jgi:2-polyprenyl-3-methyl-5-hydroxy-6-metoxy-1,4-benzoquinol methylase